MGDPWVRPDQRDEVRSKVCVFSCELDGEGGEEEVDVTPIFEISPEERSAELSICECPFCNGLRNSSLPRSCQPVQPVDGGLSEVPGPEFYLVQNGSAGSLQTTSATAVPELGSLCGAETIEDYRITCRIFISGAYHRKHGVI